MGSSHSPIRRQFLARLGRYGATLVALHFLEPARRLLSQTAVSKPASHACSIEDKIRELTVVQLQVDPKEVTLKSRFKEDLGGDSLDCIELVMLFEEAFDLEIPDDDAEKITTVGNAVEYVIAHISQAKLSPLCSP